jgi:class 3 adenylate cyclase/tetratricopeptide (TPR) repeat protein
MSIEEMPHSSTDWSRLQRYLPAEIYQKRDMGRCQKHLVELLRAVLPYIPPHVALDLLHRPVTAENTGKFLEGTLLFADISGFTNLSEKLKEMGGKAGAEEVTRIINAYLDVMLGILAKHNGLLIRFGGDAMLCLFTGEAIDDSGAMAAVRTAWEMKQVMAERFGAIEVFQQVFPLSMKVGTNSGLLFAANVGTSEHMEYLLTGSAVERTAHAESAASRGDVLISHETYELVKDKLAATALEERPGFYRVTKLHSMPDAGAESHWWAQIEKLLTSLENDLWGLVDRLDSLTPYLPAGALPLLVYDPQQGQIEGQHRQAAVVFVNFIGMSDIINARGITDVEGITADLSEYFRAMQEEVQYYGGVINKVDLYDQGDKLMVIFGAPVAHEQDAQRAALTALAMQEALKRLSSPTISAFLTQRIGIHTGFVFAGNVGSTTNHRGEYTVMGDMVNLAARLMSAAPPGQVWISHQVWEQIETGFQAQALPPISAKGISEPVPVYRLQAAGRIQRDRDWLRVLHSDVVGREAELALLAECLDDLCFDAGKQLLAIVGEAGVGKSRLIQEWQRRAASSSETANAVRWLNGRAHSYGQKTHGVLIEILEQLLGCDADAAPEDKWNKLSVFVKETFAGAAPGWFDEFSNRLAYLGHFLTLDLDMKTGLTERVTRLEADVLQLQTRLALCAVLECAARERPLVLLLDDLHWADEASLDLLTFLADRVSEAAPVLFCLLYRPQKERPIWHIWQTFERTYPDCRLLTLQELDAAHGRRLLSNLLQTAQLPEDFQALVLAETDGNPLYIEEILHSFIEDGILAQDEGSWRLTQDIARVHVPDTLYQIIQSRIDDLDFASPGSRRVLWLAAVIGDEFAEELALHIFTAAGRTQEEFLRHLRALQNAAMIEKVRFEGEGRPQRGYRFRHGLVQQVSYENIPLSRRREYHAQVGQWLEEKYPDNRQRYYDALAYHYDQGEQWEKAAHYHHLAGMQQMQRYANREAALHLQRTLEIAAQHFPLDENALLQVHEALGRVLTIIGQYDEALANLTAALRCLRDGEQRETQLHRARTCYHIGSVYERRGLLDEALDWQHRGLLLLPAEATVESAQLHALGSAIGYHKPDYALLKQEAEQTLVLAQQVDARAETAQAHNLLSIYYRHAGELAQAAEHCHRAITEYEQLADLIGTGRASLNLGVIAFEQDEWSKAEVAYQQARDGLERANESYLSAITLCNLGDLYRHLGNLDQALACAQQGLDRFVAQGSHQGIVFAHTVLATILWRQGKLEQARGALEQARAQMDAHDVRGFEPTVGRWLAEVHWTAGDIPHAEAEIQALLSMDTDVLDVEVEPIQRLRGLCLVAQGKPDEGIQVLRTSLERLEHKQARYETARTLLALAEVLAQMDDRTAEAKIHAERARAVFVDLGARLDIHETDELLARLGL